jgi:DNA (cytosine-5)-methyltransferase 1
METSRRHAPAGNLTFLEFFAGVGLIHEALRPFGWTPVFANDNDPKKERAYRANFPDVPFSAADIREINSADLPSAELATASFPCIDLSRAGGRVGLHGDSSGLVWAFLEHMRALVDEGRAPKFLLIENVTGLLSHSKNGIDELLTAIDELGYGLDVVLVDAKHFTPQTRDRVFIVGVFEALGRSLGDAPQSPLRRYHVEKTRRRNPSVTWHHFSFPDLPQRTLGLDSVMERLPDDDPLWWSPDRLEYFWDRLEVGHDDKLRDLISQGFDGFLTATRRGRRRGKREQIINIRFDRVAACLRTPRGGSSVQMIIEVRDGNVAVRPILGIEASRLQGVNLLGGQSEFALVGSRTDQLFAFGDAVCVPAVSWVVEHSIMAYKQGILRSPPQLDLALAA